MNLLSCAKEDDRSSFNETTQIYLDVYLALKPILEEDRGALTFDLHCGSGGRIPALFHAHIDLNSGSDGDVSTVSASPAFPPFLETISSARVGRIS